MRPDMSEELLAEARSLRMVQLDQGVLCRLLNMDAKLRASTASGVAMDYRRVEALAAECARLRAALCVRRV